MPGKPTYEELERRIAAFEKKERERQKVEEALKISEDRYREIVEGTENLVTEVDAHGRFTFVNEAARRIFGLPPGGCIGRLAFDFVHPDDRQKTLDHFAQWVEAKQPSVTFENRQVSLNGEVRDMLWSIKFHFDRQGDISSIKSIARDITERKNAEEALRVSNDRFQRIFKSEAIGIVLTDLDGRINEANTAFLLMTGHDRKDLPLNSFAMTPPEWKAQDGQIVRQVRKTGIVPAYEKELLRRDCTRIPVMIVGVRLKEEGDKVLCFILDQTKRKKADEDLKRSEETLASIFKAAPVGIGVVKDRVITHANLLLCHMTGYGLEELVGKSSRMLYPTREEFEQVGINKYDQIRKSGTGTVETRWQRKDGKIIHVLISSTPIHPEDWAAGITFTALDITERKLAEGELHHYRVLLEDLVRERTAELEQANEQLKLEVAERKRIEKEIRRYAETQEVLVREVNHRVKNNLSAIIGMLHMEQDRAEAEGLLSHIPVLQDLVERIGGLSTVHSLLSASGWKPLEVSALCRAVVYATLQSVPPGKRIDVDITRSRVRIDSNQAHHLTLIINELTTNAIKYALGSRHRANIRIRTDQKDQTVEILFRDDGPGYPEFIFQPGYAPASIGFELIRGIARKSLAGDVIFSNMDGAAARILFPNKLGLPQKGEKDADKAFDSVGYR